MDKLIFYHIHKKGIYDNLWKIGMELTTAQNEFTNFSFSFSPIINTDNKDMPINSLIEYYQKNNDSDNLLKLLPKLKSCIKEYQMLVRELAYEEIRKQYFNDLPSRNNCIWLCRKEQLSYWLGSFNESDVTIYKIELEHKPFKTRDTLLPMLFESYNEMKDKAKKYWEYNNDELFLDDEYLYEGKFKILSMVQKKNLNKEIK